MATPFQTHLGGAGSPEPRPPTPVTSFPENGFARTCNGDSSAVAHHIVAKPECSPEPYFLPRIPRTIAYNGVTFDVARPEELSYEVPVFGERRRKAGTAKPKKTLKRRCEEEEEIVWEAKRRRLIQERVLEKEFISYSKEEMNLTEDGLQLPDAPAWLNIDRERQDDGSWGIFIVRPSKEDIENRWSEIIQALEPIGVEIGAVKIALPSEYLDDPISTEELDRYISGVMNPLGPLPVDAPLSEISTSPIPTLSFSHTSHADLIPPPQLDKNGAPKIWIVDQCLPLHPLSVSNLAPIYCVSSTNKRQIRSTKLLASIHTYTVQQRAIAAGDPHTEIFAPLTEATMLARGRSWDRIGAGDTGGVSIYSSDNDADPCTRAFIGVGNPRLTSLPGNVMFDSKHKIVGIHTPFFYFGAAHTIFALHAEDYNAMSLNYHHFGADKIWRVVSPRYYHVVEDFVTARLLDATAARKGCRLPGKRCSQFVRHASVYLPGATLDVAGARNIQFRQRPGELVITWPLAYHEGYNEGLNINEACGYGHKNWRRVFAAGEETKNGEAAIYRPCGEKCMGGVNPIILDFDPEAEREQEGYDCDKDDISNIGEDEEIFTAAGWGSSMAGQAACRKRSRTDGDDENGENVKVKRLKPPREKKVTFKTETVKNKVGPRGTSNAGLRRRGARDHGQNSVQIAPDQLLSSIRVIARGKRPAEKIIDDQRAGNHKTIVDGKTVDIEMVNSDYIKSEVVVGTKTIADNKRRVKKRLQSVK